MAAEGGVTVVRLVCRHCGAEALESAITAGAPCPDCDGARRIAERLPDRRTGPDRRGPARLQRQWDYDPRSWFDRRQG